MARKFWSIARRCRGKDPQAVMQDALLRRLSGDDPEQFRALRDAVREVSGYLTAESCRAMAEICCDGALPAFSEEQQRRFTFLFSEGEPAHTSKKRLLRTYPAASYIDRPGNSHCGFQVSDPEGCGGLRSVSQNADRLTGLTVRTGGVFGAVPASARFHSRRPQGVRAPAHFPAAVGFLRRFHAVSHARKMPQQNPACIAGRAFCGRTRRSRPPAILIVRSVSA